MNEMKYLQTMRLSTEVEKKVAFAAVEINGITIRGITVWRTGNGRLHVFFPSHPIGRTWEESVEVSPEMRSEIEAEVIATYRAERKKAADGGRDA